MNEVEIEAVLVLLGKRPMAQARFVAHVVFCPNCRIRVRRVEAGDVPGLRGELDPSTLYVEKPDSWILCTEGRGLLEKTKAK